MLKKSIFVLSFLFLSILLMAASCGSQPKAQLDGVSPTTLTFSSQVNRTDTKTFTFSNTGDAPLTYTINKDVPWITISNSTGSLEPGGTTTVTVIASCTEVGTRTGQVTVSTNGGNSEVTVNLTCIAVPASEYDIDFQFLGAGMTPQRQNVFREAAVLWSSVVIGDLEDIEVAAGELPATNQACGFNTPAFEGTIDDLLIFAEIAFIDGEGGVLGQAGPAFIRSTTDDLTFIGCMQFDSADVEELETQGTFDEVILHEMGHVLGYGTLWEPFSVNNIDLLDEPCQSNPNATSGFKGTEAVIQFGVLGGRGNPPVENDYSQGTRCGHWDEGFFDNELMTGFLGGQTSGTVNPFSALTVASMADLGYSVDFGEAEPYSIPACSPTCDNPTLRAANVDEPWEIILKPKGTIDAKGEIVFFSDR
jgi:hypothetical protein